MYQINDVWTIKEKQEILQGVSFELKKGEFINIMGASGSGKSTLLRTLNGLESYQRGSIFYQGRDLQEIEPTALRKEVGYVFQTPYLFGELVKENLIYPLTLHKEEVQQEYMKGLLDQLNLTEDILEKKCKELSGGEQQRICLARSLMLQPKVLLLDEITSSLDPYNTKLVEDFIKKIHKKLDLTTILVTHSLEQAEAMGERTLFLSKGKIEMDSSTTDFLMTLKDNQLEQFNNRGN